MKLWILIKYAFVIIIDSVTIRVILLCSLASGHWLWYRRKLKKHCIYQSVYLVLRIWVLRIWVRFFYSQVLFTLHSLYTLKIWHNLLSSMLPWEAAVVLWRLQSFPLMFETQTRHICLFESHSLQQKALVGRFYWSVKSCYRLLY